MADLSERDILAAVRPLSGIAPSADASRRAVAAARAALMRGQIDHRALWRRRLFMSGSIAALVAIMIGIGVTFTSQRADAAALLVQVAQASDAYRGWVHVRTEGPGVVAVEHLNTADGTSVNDMTSNGVRHAWMGSPSMKERRSYDFAKKELYVTDVLEVSRDWYVEQMRSYPLTIAAALEELNERGRGESPQVRERMEDGLLRLDVTFATAATAPASQRAATTLPASLPSKATLWADPQTKLLRRCEYEVDGKAFTVTYTYGEPAVTSLYDLGVPRDARVVDKRASKELAALFERLQKRVTEGFGDGVASLTEVGRFREDEGNVQLFLRSRDAYFIGKYMVGERAAAAPPAAGWPNPAPDDLLASLRGTLPNFFYVSDGKRAWRGIGMSATDMKVFADTAHPLPGYPAPITRMVMDLPPKIWPTQMSLRANATTAKTELITDPARTGLVGLRVAQIVMLDGEEYGSEHTFWLDPARDDIPLESTETTKAGTGSMAYRKTVFAEPKQTSTGRWYPSRWTEYSGFDPITPATEPKGHFLLRVHPGYPVDASWFVNPVERLKASPTTRP